MRSLDHNAMFYRVLLGIRNKSHDHNGFGLYWEGSTADTPRGRAQKFTTMIIYIYIASLIYSLF